MRVSQRGTSLRRLSDVAERLGFRCRAIRLELPELPQLRTPAILHWTLDHFVVLESTGSRGLRVVDPAVGARRISWEEADAAFNGVALELEPTPDFQPRKKPAEIPLSAFMASFRGLEATLGGVFAMTLALQAFALVMPLNTQFTVDQGIRGGDLHLAVVLALGFGLLGLTSATTSYLRSLLIQYVGSSSAFRMVTSLVHRMMRLPDAWFEARHTGDVMSRFDSMEPIRHFLATGAFTLLVDALMAVGALGVLLAYSWRLTLAAVGFLALFAILRLGTYTALRNRTHESIAAQARQSTSFIENVERHRAIKLLGAETHRENAWGTRYVESINAGIRLGRFGIHVNFAAAALGSVESVTMLLLGAANVIDGTFTLGMLMAFTAYASMFAARVHAVIDALVDMRMLRLHRERVADVGLAEQESSPDGDGARHDLEGAIELRRVSFAYGDDERDVVSDVSLTVAPGEFVAVAGESGAGKSTVVKLLCKLLAPTGGTVSFDGVDLRGLDTVHFRRQLGVVMQDDDLFSGSIAENVAVADAVDMARVEAACRHACIHDDVMAMPMQYLTLVGHMGSTLSGGQRQRLMIARAVYRAPRVIVLDEGTAHLNDELQRQVLENLRRTRATIIAVTHDPRVLERADRVVRL